VTASLVLCAHGTRDQRGRATIRAVVDDVAARLRDVEVLEAHVDVHGPSVGDVVAALPVADPVAGVVVPLLLAAGYHVHVDIAEAVAARPDVLTSPALGPDDRLVDVVLDRLRAAGATPGSRLVLAPAGSSDPRAQADSAEVARRLQVLWGGAVSLGYAAGPAPAVADAVRSARAEDPGGPVAVASYLLAPGFFQRRLEESGADVVSEPLAPDRRIVDVVVDRYRAALSEAGA
jgi:sirohydrochlorin ferrochelatase